MADNEEMEIRAEVLTRGVQERVRTTLKKALGEQLSREAKTLGGLRGPGGEALTIHGRTGISNSPIDEIDIERR
jgi:hypothetical protein